MLPSPNYTLSVLALLSAYLFHYKILNSTDRAFHIAKHAFNDAIVKLGSLLLAPLQVLHLPPHLHWPRRLPHHAHLHRAFRCRRSTTLTATVSMEHPQQHEWALTAPQGVALALMQAHSHWLSALATTSTLSERRQHTPSPLDHHTCSNSSRP
ncbi:hypothetical protein K439DRAFT_1532888 [Ramaria rubella]|nr:hypothetical protein K439DRAFT_1532888 [Ramaria rubella]